MLSSIIGQNERWAQLAASRATPAAQSSQAAGGTNAYAPAALSSGTGSDAVTGGTLSPLSDGMNFALMAFGASSQSGGSPGATDTGSITSGGTSALSQVLTDLQSLLSSISGTSSAAGGSAASSASASDTDASSISNSGTTTSILSQDLQQLSTDLGSLASTIGATSPRTGGTPSTPPPPPSGPPPGSSDILNSGTASASAGISNTGTASAGSGWATFMQQFAAGAYGSGYDSSTTSSLMAISA